MFFFSVRSGGIKHSISEHLMADISHVFYFYPLCDPFHTQAQQIKTKTVSNDVRIRRIGGS